MAGLLAAWMLTCLWIMAASLGRIATVRALLDYFRTDGKVSVSGVPDEGEKDVAGNDSTNGAGTLRTLVRLNFLRAAVVLAAIFGFVGASILAGFASPDANPQPGLAFLLFLPLAGFVCLTWGALNWLLSLAGVFAVRDGEDAIGSISAAVVLCRERMGAVFAVSTWTGLAHLVIFVGATTVVSMPLGFVAVVPGRIIVAAMLLVTLAYFVVADWLYMARLAGYVCIVETPQALLVPAPPQPRPIPAPVQTSIDRDEVILSDLPNLAVET